MAVLSNVRKLSSRKVAIYVRVSTHWQIDKDSLKVQEKELIVYCEMILGIKDYVVFNDPGYSAKNTDRPKYQEMMERIRSGEFTHLLVWKLDRISRNIIDFAMMSEELKQLGVTFVSKNEQFDTSTAMGEAMLQIIMVFAQFERKQTAERVTAVMLSRAEDGEWNGGRVPYGYLWDKEKKEFSINPEQAEAVNQMVQMYLEKQSLLYVARTLNANSIPTRTGAMWSPTSVRTILTNSWYIGQYTYNVHSDGKGYEKRDKSDWITVEHHHEPIMDEDTFYRIKFLLARNRRGGVPAGKTYVRKNIHIFSGLMECGVCGSNMTSTTDRRRANGFQPSQYACSTRRRKGTDCTNKYISDLTVGPFVLNYIANIIRASKTNSESTSQEVLERKLLRGPVFDSVDHVSHDAVQSLISSFAESGDAVEYRPLYAFTKVSKSTMALDKLEAKKRRLSTALARLNTLYLYDEQAMPEKDFILERTKIENQLSDIDKHIEAESGGSMVVDTKNSNFIKKASFYIMANKLIDDYYVDYESFVKSVDPDTLRGFITSVVSRIVATDGKIMSIKFKNGVTHQFTYKQ